MKHPTTDNNNEDMATTAVAIRHHWIDRLFHWSMAVITLILLFSAFLPIVGIEFDWIPWHWIAGVVLCVLVLFHIIRAIFFQSIRNMLPVSDDFKEVLRSNAALIPAKYDAFQKGYHWAIAVTVLALIATGIPMLIKLDTPFWDRNPSLLTDIQWGYVYVVHGLTALLLIFLVLLHLYFSLLPEHKNLLVSMLSGRGPAHARMGNEKENLK